MAFLKLLFWKWGIILFKTKYKELFSFISAPQIPASAHGRAEAGEHQ